MRHRKNRGAGRTVRLGVTALVAVGSLATPAVAQLSFEYAEEPEALVIQMSRDVGIVDPDSPPLVRVYGDGLVRIHYPPYMRRAGDYTIQLDEPELRDLIASIVDAGLVDFSPQETRAQIRQAETALRRQPGAQLTTRSDAEMTTIEIRLRRYTPAGAAARSDVNTRIVWSDARYDAGRYPELDTLQALATVEGRLQALAERSDAVQVPE